MNNTAVQIKKAYLPDIHNLQKHCRSIYTIYFGNYRVNNGLEKYLQEQFGIKKLESDLINPAIDYHFILFKEKTMGFIKVNNKVAFENFDESITAELEKMYILPAYKGKGIGKIALDNVIKIIKKKGKQLLFLGVLNTNKDAIEFYEKIGFKFHSMTYLKYDLFKEELKELNYMYLEI